MLLKASSISSEKLFPHLGRRENQQNQSLLTGVLETFEYIRVFVHNEILKTLQSQNGLLHPEAAVFTVAKVDTEVFKEQ